MKLTRLEIRNVRNLENLDLNCAERFNLIHGENGSGKTSILEAIYLLALGRSFRSHLKSRLINHEANTLSVFGNISATEGRQIPAGIQKFVSGETVLRLNGQNAESIAEFAKLLPIQLFNPDSYELLSAGSKLRRQFIDWGVFHVEPQFYQHWAKVERILKQRNAILRQQASHNEIMAWDNELSALAEQLHIMRSIYIEQLLPVVEEFTAKFPEFPSLNIEYYPGWDIQQTLSEQLAHTISRDLFIGYTQVGPQRANLYIKLNNKPSHEVLSRGQQKLLVFILRFAQAELLRRQHGKTCLYLIDDLASELDPQRRKQLVDLIQCINGQFFITGVDLTGLQSIVEHEEAKVFHVKQMEKFPAAIAACAPEGTPP